LPGGARVRHAAACRYLHRTRSHDGDPRLREFHPRSDRVPEDGHRHRFDVRRAVAGRCQTAQGVAPAAAEMRKIALPQEGIETLYGARDANLKHIESLLNVDIRTQGAELTVLGDPGSE